MCCVLESSHQGTGSESSDGELPISFTELRGLSMKVICIRCGKEIKGRKENHWCDEAQAEVNRMKMENN